MFNLQGYQELKKGLDHVYGLMTKDPETIRKHSRDHQERGAMRSGQGTPEQTHRRNKLFEERTRVEQMLENSEVPTDIITSNKMLELWTEKQADRAGIRQDDK
jgi:hypothetical protein